jgi:hypothetical protein
MVFSQPLKNLITKSRKILFLGSKAAAVAVSRFSRQCAILNISDPYRFPRPVTGTPLLPFATNIGNRQQHRIIIVLRLPITIRRILPTQADEGLLEAILCRL